MREEIYDLGSFSREMLRSEQFNKVLKMLKDDIKNEIVNTKMNQMEVREGLYYTLLGINRFEMKLQDYDNQLSTLELEGE